MPGIRLGGLTGSLCLIDGGNCLTPLFDAWVGLYSPRQGSSFCPPNPSYRLRHFRSLQDAMDARFSDAQAPGDLG